MNEISSRLAIRERAASTRNAERTLISSEAFSVEELIVTVAPGHRMCAGGSVMCVLRITEWLTQLAGVGSGFMKRKSCTVELEIVGLGPPGKMSKLMIKLFRSSRPIVSSAILSKES